MNIAPLGGAGLGHALVSWGLAEPSAGAVEPLDPIPCQVVTATVDGFTAVSTAPDGHTAASATADGLTGVAACICDC